MLGSAWHHAGRIVSAQRNWYFCGHCEGPEHVYFKSSYQDVRVVLALLAPPPDRRLRHLPVSRGGERAGPQGAGPKGGSRRSRTVRPYQHRGPPGRCGLRAQGQRTRASALSPRTHCFPPWSRGPVSLDRLAVPTLRLRRRRRRCRGRRQRAGVESPAEVSVILDSFTPLELQSTPVTSEELKLARADASP